MGMWNMEIEEALVTVINNLENGYATGTVWKQIPGVNTTEFGVPTLGSLSKTFGTKTCPKTHLQAIVLASELSITNGAPLSPALRGIQETLIELRHLKDQQNSQLSGPRASAHLLCILPILGIGGGYLLGANPIQIMVSNPVGNLAALAGLLFLLIGSLWTRRLIQNASEQSNFT